MKIIVPNTYASDDEHYRNSDHRSEKIPFDPLRGGDGTKMVCRCGYELIKEDDGGYRCTGGSHKYNISEGDVLQDKFGNITLMFPEDGANE